MGILEKVSKKRTRKKNLQKIILETVAAVDILSIALVTPNALQALKVFGYDPRKKRQKEIIKNSTKRLLDKNLLEFKDGFLRACF